MATLGSPAAWIPEDDLLLKNAVEGGASLESLAKGAVRFSRKFTVAELRERWRSLLYDPIVSAEASARMTESELSAKKSGNGNKNVEVGSKRQSESIRKLYYAMHKRNCRDSRIIELSDLNYLVDLNILEEGNPSQCLRDECCEGLSDQPALCSLKQSSMCDEDSVRPKNLCNELPGRDRGKLLEEIDCSHAPPNNSASYQLSGFPSLRPGHSILTHIEENSMQGMPMNVSLEGEVQGGQEAMLPPDKMDFMEYGSVHGENGDQIGDSATISDKYFMDMSDCLLNFANEDELVSLDTDGKVADNVGQDVKDENSHVVSASCVSNHPENKHDDNAPTPADASMLGRTTCLASQGSGNPENLDAVAGQSHPGHIDQLNVSASETNKPSATESSSQFLATIYDEATRCTLNTEDPEIPCNDDFPSAGALSCSGIQQSSNGSPCVAFASTNKKAEEQSAFKQDGHRPELALMVCQIPQTPIKAETSPNSYCGNTGFEVSDAKCTGIGLKEATDVQYDMDPSKLLAGFSGSAKDCTLLERFSVTDFPTKAAEDSSLCDVLELDGSPSGIDYNEDESDLHVPNFAYLEAMILGMDLCPKDCDSYASKEVSRYKHDDARRAIIRREQCARSSIQRCIGTRGALAVLYGHQSKHYIKKAEVILGRSTLDFDVDIDLVREGGTNRISRRQALIKLEREGSFYLKNLGKNSVFLNGKEVFNGECIRLTQSCLIEVKEITFVFVMNDKCVRQYLGRLARESKRETKSFEWSPEGVP